MKRLLPALVALVLFVSVDPAVRLRLAAWAGPPAAKGELADLASIYSIAAGAVRDTNGDGLADAVAARVVLPAEPAVEDIEAAANIAGRLGFETTALTLPIVLKAPDVTQPASIAVPIIVGRTNAFIAKLVEKGAIDLKPLKPGQGLLTVVSSPLGGPDGIAVGGGDDEGTLNAANELAVNLPRLWGATGARISQAESQTAAYLKSRNAPGTVRGVASMLVDSDRRGLARMTLRVDAAPGDVARTTKAIEELDLAHRRGLEPDTLNYANAAATVVEVWASGRKAAEATVRRSGLNPRTLTPPDDELGRGAIAVAPSAGGGSGPAGARGAAGGGPTGARGGRGAGAPGAGAAAAAGGEEPPAGGRGDVAPVQGGGGRRRRPGGWHAAAGERGGDGSRWRRGTLRAAGCADSGEDVRPHQRVLDRGLVWRLVRRLDSGSSRDGDRCRRRAGIVRRGAHRDAARSRDDRHHASARARRPQDHERGRRTESHPRRAQQRARAAARQDRESASRRSEAR